MQILSVDLGTDVLPALALGTEKPEPLIMERKPRSTREGLFDFGLLLRAYMFLGIMIAAGSMCAYFFVLSTGGWHYGDTLARNSLLYIKATTACWAGIACIQVVNSFMCRSDRQSIFSLGILSNKSLLAAIACELLLVAFIVYTPPGHLIFRTAPLGFDVFFCIAPFMIAMVSIEELRKWLLRKVEMIRQPISQNKDAGELVVSRDQYAISGSQRR
jgi:magnesium-transporting ATPase (P-type)